VFLGLNGKIDFVICGFHHFLHFVKLTFSPFYDFVDFVDLHISPFLPILQ